MKEHVIQKAEETWNAWSADRQTRKEAQTKKEEQKEESEKEETKNTGKNPADRAEYDSGRDRHGFFRRYGRFAGAGQLCPQEGGVLFTVTQEEMPTDTIYVSEKYGKKNMTGDPGEKEVRRIKQVYIYAVSILFETTSQIVQRTAGKQILLKKQSGSWKKH